MMSTVPPVAAERSALPNLVPKVESWVVVRSSDGRGGACGDVAFSLPLDSGSTALIVVDVAGHGAGRAPLAAALADAIVAELLADGSAAAALGSADARLRSFADDSPYAVAFIALLNPASRAVAYASAGHDVAFTLSEDGRSRPLRQTAPMLGVPFAVHPCDAMHALGRSETLVIVTDGVSDSRPIGTTDFFGAGRTAAVVARSLRRGHDPARDVLAAACAHAGGRQDDDIGILVARICDDHPSFQRGKRRCCERGSSGAALTFCSCSFGARCVVW
jgi:phosphoserine phosphatase RsbU/P